MTLDARTICALCAWRGTCAKRFNVEKNKLRCPDYSRDVTIAEPEQTGEPKPDDPRHRGLPAWGDDED
ncbi:MAG: hypothetical protein P9M14_03660 [Candidatus Alcyoniella australis]|nr:hypothetical protein [Candidatus Alcyoniella australis]